MRLFSVALFAACANLDSLAVGLSYGMGRVIIGRLACLLISAIAFLGTFCSIVLGDELGRLIPMCWAGALGGLIILGMGLWGIFCWQKGCRDSRSEARPPVEISLPKAGLLGIALTVNNAALGIGAGMSGLNPALCAGGSMLFSFIFLRGGNRLGSQQLSCRFGRLAEPAAAILMLALGCCELLG